MLRKKTTEQRVVRDADKIVSLKENIDALSWDRILEIGKALPQTESPEERAELSRELISIAQANLSLSLRLGIDPAPIGDYIMASGVEVVHGGLAEAALNERKEHAKIEPIENPAVRVPAGAEPGAQVPVAEPEPDVPAEESTARGSAGESPACASVEALEPSVPVEFQSVSIAEATVDLPAVKKAIAAVLNPAPDDGIVRPVQQREAARREGFELESLFESEPATSTTSESEFVSESTSVPASVSEPELEFVPAPAPAPEPKITPVVATAPALTPESKAAPAIEPKTTSVATTAPAPEVASFSAPAFESLFEPEPAPAVALPASVQPDEQTQHHAAANQSARRQAAKQKFARFRNIYASRDGGLCVFEDEHGHLVAVDASKLA